MAKERQLTIKQIEILTDAFKRQVDGETLENIAKSHGITRKTLYEWRKTKHWKHLELQLQKELLNRSAVKILEALERKALEGSYKHIELWTKITGLYKESKEVTTIDATKRDIKNEGLSKEELADLEALLEEPTLRRVK